MRVKLRASAFEVSRLGAI